MRPFILYSFLALFSLSAFSQVDSKNKSISIPAVTTKEDPEAKPKLPINRSDNNIGLNMPKTLETLEFPKKEFSMFPKERFGNPGELYEKELNDELEDIKLSKKEIEMRNGSLTDQYFGDFKSNSEYVNVVYRDHGYVDGDIIQVRVNDDIIHARVFLSGGFKGFKLDLKPGFNKIDFVALNQGESGPNTAEFKVVDDAGLIVTHNRWNLSTGVKATVIVVKE
ncbi:hypothetical protein VOI54_14055 [Tamlana sp. 2201CG12-4]|uniref:hypothetical protein n=1 Tax=Tamlana sp. 2201CG12-4 TaxID=3112582 RepID=UPI002DBBB888|nr:hypothetical protein [Tamlana sp. 2201CG12-4]MEC3908150.1 hypothetical protein [Tamlana sp. 2201CG12-4]